MKKYILNPLLQEVKRSHLKLCEADQLHFRQIKRFGFHKLRTAVEMQGYEVELELASRSKTAYAFNEFNQKLKGMQSLKFNLIQKRKTYLVYQRKVYEKHLLRNTFRTFVKLQAFLKHENKIILEQQMKIVNKFRFIKLTNKVFDQLFENKESEKISRVKN